MKGECPVDMLAEILINLLRNNESTICRNVRVLQDDVGGVVTGQFRQRQVALGHEYLLDPSMTPAMEGIQVRIAAHLSETRLEPTVELVARDGPEVSLKVAGLEEGSVSRDVFVTDHAAEERECSHRA